MNSIYTIIYTSASGTVTHERKTQRGAINLAKRLMWNDNARNIQVEKTQYDLEGTKTGIVYSQVR